MLVSRCPPEALEELVTELTAQTKRTLNLHFAVSERFVREMRDSVRECGVSLHDSLKISFREIAVLSPRFFRRGVNHFGVDELYLAFAVLRLFVREHPDVGRYAGVVEHLLRELDYRFDKVVFEDPAPDVALTLTSITSKER